jgi:hypothetical protein
MNGGHEIIRRCLSCHCAWSVTVEGGHGGSAKVAEAKFFMLTSLRSLVYSSLQLGSGGCRNAMC